jgi:hypothetical protein
MCLSTKRYIDRQSTVLYLPLKSMSAVAIHKDLMDALRSDAMTYSTVALYLREA